MFIVNHFQNSSFSTASLFFKNYVDGSGCSQNFTGLRDLFGPVLRSKANWRPFQIKGVVSLQWMSPKAHEGDGKRIGVLEGRASLEVGHKIWKPQINYPTMVQCRGLIHEGHDPCAPSPLIIFNTSFVIKKVMLIFCARCILSLKIVKCTSKTIFHGFSENISFFKTFVE